MSTTLRLALLGGLQVTRDGSPLTGFAYAKAQALLCYLAVTGRSHFRDELAGLLWSELSDTEARTNLRQVLSNLRQLVPDHLHSSRDAIAFNRDAPYVLDVEQFLASLQPHDAGQADVARVRQALDLYKGDFLQGFYVREAVAFEEWVAAQRERLRHLALNGLHALIVHATARHDYAAGIDYATRLLALDPWREDAHRQLMLLLAQSGQRDAALAQYEQCRRVLEVELGVEPDAATTELAAQIRAGTLAGRPALPPPQPPIAPTSLLGRDAELAQVVAQLMQPACRLLTLVGPGGVGKTRLALAVADHLRDAFADGVILVDLAPISDPHLVVPAIAQTLAVEQTAGRTPLHALREHLNSRRLLLVLDNFEQLLEEAPAVAELLATARQLKVLVTSRAALRLRGEHEFAVAPLALPPAGRDADIDTLLAYPAVALFVERARGVNRSFQLTPANARAVAAICRRLDGLPLALELAAARAKALAPEAILARLDQALPLLAGGQRDLPERQQTMRRTIGWSYDLLDEASRPLFRRLSVFAGGWTLEAAEAVGRPSPHGGTETLEQLAHLVDQSLVVAEPAQGDGEVRYRMLEPIRQYARELLVTDGETETVHQSYACYYLSLAEAARPELSGPGQRTWLDRLEAEHDNLRGALASLHMQGQAELLLRLAAALYQFWYFRGHMSEGRTWLERALAASLGVESKARADALIGAGQLAWRQGDYGRQEAFLAEGLSLSRKLGDKRVTAAALGGLGNRAWYAGQREPAAELFEASLQLHREIGDKRGVAIMLKNLGALAGDAGDYLRATELVEESLALRREIGDVRGVAVELQNLASVWHKLGEHGRARALLIESLRICRELGEKRVMVLCLEMFATLAGVGGEIERAARLWGASQAVRDALGTPAQPHQAVADEAEKQRARTQIGDIAWAAAWEQGQVMTLEHAVAYALEEWSPDRPGSRQT